MEKLVWNRRYDRIQRGIQYACLGAGILLVAAGLRGMLLNIWVLGLTLIFLNNVLYAFEKIKERLFFLFLHITYFTFLLGRPFIGMCRGSEWWNTASQDVQNVKNSLIIMTISLIALFIGAVIAGAIHNRDKKVFVKKVSKEKNHEFRVYLQAVALVMFYVTMIFFLTVEIEKVVFMHGKDYVLYYTAFESRLPGYVHTIAALTKYSLCIFLATFPEKRRTFCALSVFVLSAIPSLLVGMRNQIVLNLLFVLVYYLIRDLMKDKEKWIGKAEKALITIATPLLLIFMGAYSYIRANMAVSSKNPFNMLIEFFYAQGVSFDVLSIGFGYAPSFPKRPFRNYTFGGFIDYILYGNVGQRIFGTEPLPNGNNVINGTLSNNLAHNLGYASKKEYYLQGQGWGSSYILENYVDWGWIGVFIFNVALGALLLWMMYRLGKSYLLNTIILVSLTAIFYIPRAEATGWLTFIITIQFWVCTGACYLGAYLCTRVKIFGVLVKKLHLYKE